MYRNYYVHLQKVTVKPPTANKHKSRLGLTDETGGRIQFLIYTFCFNSEYEDYILQQI